MKGLTVGVVGLGLIGGSIARRLAGRRECDVVAFDTNLSLRRRAQGVVRWCATLDALVEASDIVVLAVPVPAIVALLPEIARASLTRERRRRLLVTDVGSIKAPVARAAARYLAAFDYVGLHPIAGGEVNGWRASQATLFEGRTFVYCPAGRRPDRLARALITTLGGKPVAMDPLDHDRMAAETIGLPHLLAFAASGLRPPATARHPLRGTSWAGLTRVSVSDPAFVAGLLHTNGVHQRRVLRVFRERLAELERLLAQPTAAPLARALRTAGRGRS
jgi:prephenate dehydrogenase